MTDTGIDEAATAGADGAAAPLGAWRRMRLWASPTPSTTSTRD